MVQKRTEINSKYKWDLKKMFENQESLLNSIEKFKIEVEKLVTYKNQILKNSVNLLKFLKQKEIVDRILEQLYSYTHMLNDTDLSNTKYKDNVLKIKNLVDEMIIKTSFIKPEILKSDINYINSLIKECKDLEIYKFYFEEIFRYQKYTLSDKEEVILSKISSILNTSNELHRNLTDVDINLGKIKKDKNNIQLNHTNFIKLMSDNDRSVRKQAFNTMYKYFSLYKNTLSVNYKNKVKENVLISSIKGFKCPLTKSLYQDNIEEKLYTNLINQVNNNLNIMERFLEVKRKLINVPVLHMYDIHTKTTLNNDKYSFEKCKDILFEAFKPLGQNYLIDLNKAFEDRWIDVYPNVGKRSGAYSFGCYDSLPYLLLNYNDTINDVSTAAHELGHSMHSFYTRKNQPYIYGDYPIFLAEIASTVNEILLSEYLLNHASNKEEKITILVDFLDKVRSTLFRQTMFAEFEMIIHDKEKRGISLTEEEISSTYFKLNKKYHKNIKNDNYIRYEWARIPHFYSSFYVYKYATGISCAISIANKLLKNDKKFQKKYIEFLSSGSKDYPNEILNELGININDDLFIKEALEYTEKKLNELESLI